MIDQNFSHIKVPTALLDSEQARRNIRIMAEKSTRQNIRFRPHFKTHQSAEIGEWFRTAGVGSITVSSVRMAAYYADNGWRDILIAFPANMRELSEINDLAERVDLSLIVESSDVAVSLDRGITHATNVWVKVDTGMRRAGIWWENTQEIEKLCRVIHSAKNLKLSGLLTHAGQTYHAATTDEIRKLYKESNRRLTDLRDYLKRILELDLEISVGDTPGCWLSDELGEVDEIRPGNFLLFDAMMMDLGVCRPEDVALVVACPVVAKHKNRNEVVIYGGAIHLSKEFILREEHPFYGYAVELNGAGWKFLGRDNYVVSLSQEHGIIRVTDEVLAQMEIGGLVGIIPVHSCLTVDTLGYLVDLQENRYDTLRTR
jgi:D-serine deaminase-like pyridoxal phosphate-dependent protein